MIYIHLDALFIHYIGFNQVQNDTVQRPSDARILTFIRPCFLHAK